MGPTAASILSTLEPVVTVALALVVFGESLRPAQLAGGALVLLAVLAVRAPVRIASTQSGTARRGHPPPRRRPARSPAAPRGSGQVKAWLARAVANTALRGEQGRNRLVRWSHWFASTPAVDETRFQAADDPYPRHWREFPHRWPSADPDEPSVNAELVEALAELPRTWRDVVVSREVRRRSAAEVAAGLGLTAGQERAVLNRARAMLRERLARLFTRADAA